MQTLWVTLWPWWDRQGCYFVDPSWVEPSVDSRNRYPSWVEVSTNVDVGYHHLSKQREKHPCLQYHLNSPNPSLYILASCMLYFPLPIYSLHACLICIVCAEIVPKTSLKPKRLKNCNFSTKCLITPPSRHTYF